MPAFALFFKHIGVWVFASVIGRIILAIGIGFYTYTKLDEYIIKAMNYMTQYFSELPVSLLQIMRIAEVDTAISIIFSAILSTVAVRAGMIVLGVRS